MKRLTITYGDMTLCDEEVEEITWSDKSDGIGVSAKRPRAQQVGISGLLGQLAGSSRTRTNAIAAAKRADIDADTDPDPEVLNG